MKNTVVMSMPTGMDTSRRLRLSGHDTGNKKRSRLHLGISYSGALNGNDTSLISTKDMIEHRAEAMATESKPKPWR